MDFVALNIHFVLLVLCVVDARLVISGEESCARMTKIPFYLPDYVLGNWRVYYTFGSIKLKTCTYAHIMPVSPQTQEYYARRYNGLMEEKVDWFSSELKILFGTGVELLMFASGDVRGRFYAMERFHGAELSEGSPISLVKYAIKAFNFFRYLIVLDCSGKGRGYLMARPSDTAVSTKEIINLVDTVLPGKIGHFACLPDE